VPCEIIYSLQPEDLSSYLQSMRVIAGSHRGRRLCGPQGTALRPTSDKVREALFSILGTQVLGGRFLDLYAGTGAVGIEALSRGASAVTFVESDPKAVQLLRKNLQTCRLLDRAQVRIGQTAVFLDQKDWWGGPYDVLFADPPYAALDELEIMIHAWRPGLLSERATVIIEQDSRTELPALIDHAALVRRYVYGDTALYLYGVTTAESTAS
jgi:16S rRNA (guanine966-N2)-methyltransferase